MSSMKDLYLEQLRPMDGQQPLWHEHARPKTAAPAKPASPTTPRQQSLFPAPAVGDVSVLAADLARMMEDDDDNHPE